MLQHADLFIHNITVYTQDAQRTVLPATDVAVKDGRITAIGKNLQEQWEASVVLDGTGKALFPGMHNMHVHVFQSLLKGLGADLNLLGWVAAATMKTGPAMTGELYRLGCTVAAMESLKSGVTTLADFNYLQHDDEIPHACIETMERIGIRGIYMDCYHDTGTEMGVDPAIIHPADECIRRTEALVKKYHTDAHPLIRVWAGASVPWATTERLYRAMAEYSKSSGVLYSMHILETEEDNQYTYKHYGKSVVETLEAFGVLSERLLAVHCVCLKDAEIEALARHRVNAVYCPMANTYLGSGISPIAAMHRRGVTITMGTDGAASNNSSDMLESMKMGLLLQKGAARDASVLTAQNMLDFTTISPAKAAGRDDLGSIEVGKQADLFVYNPAYLRSSPNFNTLATLMYNSSQENIETTIVNGRIVYDKGSFACGLDEAAVVAEVEGRMRTFMSRI